MNNLLECSIPKREITAQKRHVKLVKQSELQIWSLQTLSFQ
jgi:hypothetical protein